MRFGYILSNTCIRVVLLSLCTCLVSCKYLFGEPLEGSQGPVIGIELTINGEHFEDTAYGKGFGLDLSGYAASFYSDEKDSVYVCFESSAPYISLSLVDLSSFFVEGKKYDYRTYNGFSTTKVHGRVEGRSLDARAVDGWYLFSREPNNPYDEIVVCFEFDCLSESGDTVEVRDGVFKISKDFWVNRDSLLIKELILNE